MVSLALRRNIPCLVDQIEVIAIVELVFSNFTACTEGTANLFNPLVVGIVVIEMVKAVSALELPTLLGLHSFKAELFIEKLQIAFSDTY